MQEDSKECIRCHQIKPLTDFYVHSQMADRHLNKCKECCRVYAKHNPHAKANDLKRHRYNPDRFLKHKYYMIRRRCVSPNLAHKKYQGLDYLSWKEWELWCKQNYKTFMALYTSWQKGGFPRKLAPSIDRIDNDKGYIVGNLQWITQSENSKKQWEDKRGKDNANKKLGNYNSFLRKLS